MESKCGALLHRYRTGEIVDGAARGTKEKDFIAWRKLVDERARFAEADGRGGRLDRADR
jgi:hypothetical protein